MRNPRTVVARRLFVLVVALFVVVVTIMLQAQSQQSPRGRLTREPQNSHSISISRNNNNNYSYSYSNLKTKGRVALLLTSPASASDRRGWLFEPVQAAATAGLAGGARSCVSLHVGEIRSGGVRGNHRHSACNETFLIWGADTIFRFEEDGKDKPYVDVFIGADEVAVAVSPSKTAHALKNVDDFHSTYFLGCQDAIINPGQDTVFNVWKDL